MWQVVSVIALLVAVGADTESGADHLVKAPFGIVWTLVGATTPFSTWSVTAGAGGGFELIAMREAAPPRRERSRAAVVARALERERSDWLLSAMPGVTPAD